MSDVEVGKWENELLEISVWTIKIGKKFWFIAKDIAEALGYTEPKRAIQDHVDPEDKKTIRELLGPNFKMIFENNFKGGNKMFPPSFLHNLQPNQIVFNALGVYSLCTKSRKKKALPFQRWIYKTIETIRETGSYTLPCGPIENPLDLIAEVSNLREEIQSLKKEIKTCDKGTQTPQNTKSIERSLSRLENEIRRTKNKFTKSLKKVSPSNSDFSDSSSSRRFSSSDSD